MVIQIIKTSQQNIKCNKKFCKKKKTNDLQGKLNPHPKKGKIDQDKKEFDRVWLYNAVTQNPITERVLHDILGNLLILNKLQVSISFRLN